MNKVTSLKFAVCMKIGLPWASYSMRVCVNKSTKQGILQFPGIISTCKLQYLFVEEILEAHTLTTV